MHFELLFDSGLVVTRALNIYAHTFTRIGYSLAEQKM